MSHEKLELILKVAGTGLTGSGSLILAWRVKSIIQWVVYSVVAHEESLDQVSRVLSGQQQTGPIIKGVPKHLLTYLDSAGFYLLVAGFICVGVGMILNMIQYLI
jgi:hypothetical protein